MKNSFILIDGSFYFYRSYYSFSFINNKLGENIGAIYGVLKFIKKIILKYSPKYIVITFDSKKKNFRNKIFKYYKYNRPIMPKGLINQINPLFKIIKIIGIPLLIVNNVEADDVIGTLSLQAKKNGQKVLICTGDNDMLQLVTSKVNLILNKYKNIIKPKDIKKKFGISPKLITDYLALKGDRVDNIPGVPGIGKKTALILIQKIGGLKKIYQKIEIIKKLKLRNYKNIINLIKENYDLACLSYKLALIKTDVKLNQSYYELILTNPNFKNIIKLLNRYEFIFLKKLNFF